MIIQRYVTAKFKHASHSHVTDSGTTIATLIINFSSLSGPLSRCHGDPMIIPGPGPTQAWADQAESGGPACLTAMQM